MTVGCLVDFVQFSFIFAYLVYVCNSNRWKVSQTKGIKNCLVHIVVQLIHCIVPKKHACLNKCTPNFWVSLAITQELLIWSWPTFYHIKSSYSNVCVANFIEIEQGHGLVFCLHAQRVYSALYDTCNHCVCMCVGVPWCMCVGMVRCAWMHTCVHVCLYAWVVYTYRISPNRNTCWNKHTSQLLTFGGLYSRTT